MTILEKKVDAIARSLLAENPASRDAALKDLEQLMSGNIPAGTVQEEIDHILTQLGVPSRASGYRDLSEAIRLCAEDSGCTSHTLFRELYTKVAQVRGGTWRSAERRIGRSIEYCIERCDPDVIKHYFGNTVSPAKGKPTNSEFIVRISDIVRSRTEGSA